MTSLKDSGFFCCMICLDPPSYRLDPMIANEDFLTPVYLRSFCLDLFQRAAPNNRALFAILSFERRRRISPLLFRCDACN